MNDVKNRTRYISEPPAGARCDRCPAEAKVRFTLQSGLDLDFCGHHTKKYEDALISATEGAVGS